jgi:TatD DNase family protein
MALRFVDTHAHLNAAAFAPDVDAIVEESLRGLEYVVDVATDRPSCERSLELSRRFERIFSTVGVHPHDASKYDDAALEAMFPLADQPKVVALGEMGLDYHYNFSPPDAQRHVFRRQVLEAVRRSKPVVVHIRDAFDDALAILGESRPAGVLHCFTGTWEQAQAALALGMYISLSGVVTFKNAEGLREVARQVPADRLLLETDCPYLTPHPHRNQKRNAPPMVHVTAELVARTRGVSLDELAGSTTTNACRLFGIPLPGGTA